MRPSAAPQDCKTHYCVALRSVTCLKHVTALLLVAVLTMQSAQLSTAWMLLMSVEGALSLHLHVARLALAMRQRVQKPECSCIAASEPWAGLVTVCVYRLVAGISLRCAGTMAVVRHVCG